MSVQVLDAIVIGAGAAGLMAGHTLELHGVSNFAVLEAHDRIGGRVKKLEGFADFPIDLGGEWVSFDRNKFNSIYEKLDGGVNPVRPNDKDHQTFAWYPVSPWYEFESGNYWTEAHTWEGELNHFVNYTYADYLNDYIASDIMDHIQLNCVVNRIEYESKDGNSPITVSCKDGRQYQSHEVILTANPKVMRDIEFVPSLPEHHQEAMRDFVIPSGMKAFLKFDRTFYHESFGFRGDLDAQPERNPGERYFYDTTIGQNTDDHILSVFLRGSLADEYVEMSDMHVVITLLEELDEMYDGMASEAFLDGYVQNWSKDPFVQGSYSEYPGYDMWHQEVFKESVTKGNNRIQFAGEHLSTEKWDWAFVHSATQSGCHAAMEVLDEM